MKKALTTVLIISLILNAVLIIGFLTYKSYVKKSNFELAAINAQSEASLLTNILTDLDPNDPAKIEALKKRLQDNIKNAKEVEEIWRQAAER